MWAEKQFTCGKKTCGKVVCGTHGRAHDKHKTIAQWKNSESVVTRSDTTEAIASIAATPSTVTETRFSQAVAPIIAMNSETSSRNIVVENCRVSFCSADGTLKCEDCGISVCSAHGKEHSKHETLSILNIEHL